MLVLTRKMEESIVIGQEIRIKVVGIQNGKVKLAIEAPSDVRILRGELLSRSSTAVELPEACCESAGSPPAIAVDGASIESDFSSATAPSCSHTSLDDTPPFTAC